MSTLMTPVHAMMAKTAIAPPIGNELFAWFSSTESKSRINFLSCLGQGSDSFYVLKVGLRVYGATRTTACSVNAS